MKFVIEHRSYLLNRPFAISRGSRTHAHCVYLRLTLDHAHGQACSVAYPRYGETPASVEQMIRDALAIISSDKNPARMRQTINATMPAGAARNVLDCALWDLEAKLLGVPVWKLAGMAAAPNAQITAYTISLDAPDAMECQAEQHRHYHILKLKLAGDDRDLSRMAAVKRAAPNARLIVDANEGYLHDRLAELDALLAAKVDLIEQPVPAGSDQLLDQCKPGQTAILCADESIHTRADLAACKGRYRAINIKLDKTGGLTEALALQRQALAEGFQ
ncbi:MAG: enolase C-terminal domain-like protein, partial [Pseudomonadota bacterium]